MSSFFAKLWQALVSGLSIGSIYALIAEGYYITFVTTGALNFGQGEFLMIGALFGLDLLRDASACPMRSR